MSQSGWRPGTAVANERYVLLALWSKKDISTLGGGPWVCAVSALASSVLVILLGALDWIRFRQNHSKTHYLIENYIFLGMKRDINSSACGVKFTTQISILVKFVINSMSGDLPFSRPKKRFVSRNGGNKFFFQQWSCIVQLKLFFSPIINRPCVVRAVLQTHSTL